MLDTALREDNVGAVSGGTLVGAAEVETRRVMSVMFCDMAGSTALALRQKPEQHRRFMLRYYAAAEPVVERYGGKVRQHLGDGLFIYFGHDDPLEDHALLAVRCALEMATVLRAVSRELHAEMGEPLDVRIGINSGSVVLAAVTGETGPLAFGDTASVAAKVQAVAPRGRVAITPTTLGLAGPAVVTEPLGPLELVPGRTPLDVYLVVNVERPRWRPTDWLSPFVGRLEELAVGAAALPPAAFDPGRRGLVRVTGEAGVGKTRYLAELSRMRPDLRWLTTRCERLFDSVPGLPFCQLGRELAGIEPDDAPEKQRALAGDFLERLGLDSSPARVGAFVGAQPDPGHLAAAQLDPSAWHMMTTGWAVEWLSAVIGSEPTVVVVDDLQNADPTSLRILAGLCGATAPVAVVTAARDGEAPRHPDTGLPLTPHSTLVTLDPLPSDTALRLASQLGPTRSPGDLESIARRSGGLPLFVEHLAQLDHEAGQLPIQLEDLLGARLRASGVDARIIAVAAVPPSGFDCALVEAGSGFDAETVGRSVSQLLASGLVAEVRPGHFAYRHEIVREAAGDLLLDEERRSAYARLVVALRDRGYLGRSAPAALIAELETEAGNPLGAVEILQTGAVEAQAAGAHREAISLLSAALSRIGQVGDAHARVAIELMVRAQRGFSAITTEGYASAAGLEDFDRCLELCSVVGRREELLPLLTSSWAYYTSRGDMSRSAEVARQLREIIDQRHDQFRPENDTAFGVLSFFRGEYGMALEHLDVLRTMLPDPELEGRIEQAWSLPNDPLSAGLAHLAVVQWTTGAPREAVVSADNAILRAVGLPFPRGPFSLAYAKTWVGHMYRLRGDDQAADMLAQEVIDLGERHGFIFWHLTGLLQQAIGRALGGDMAQTAALEAMIRAWAALGARVFMPYNYGQLGRAHLAGGRHDDAVAALDVALSEAHATGAHFHTAEILRLRGLAERGRGNADAAHADLERAATIALSQGAAVFALRAAIAMADSPDDPKRQIGRTLAARLAAAMPPGVGLPELNEVNRLGLRDQP